MIIILKTKWLSSMRTVAPKLDNNHLPVVPCRFRKANVENYYAENCGALTNRKEADNYLDFRCG